VTVSDSEVSQYQSSNVDQIRKNNQSQDKNIQSNDIDDLMVGINNGQGVLAISGNDDAGIDR